MSDFEMSARTSFEEDVMIGQAIGVRCHYLCYTIVENYLRTACSILQILRYLRHHRYIAPRIKTAKALTGIPLPSQRLSSFELRVAAVSDVRCSSSPPSEGFIPSHLRS